ncbi:hypothetical protein Tco_0605296 [Tanacetum coccineum]
MNKFCDYHQDRGHNTNDCYHLKKQIDKAVASGILAHLLKDIRQGGQKGKSSAKGKEKVINMVRSQGNLSYQTRSRLKESRVPLVGFSGEVSYPLGVIDLEFTMGECEKTRTVIMEFAVVKSPSPYNALLGRMGMRSLGAVASTVHSMIKFLTSNGIATIATTKETLRDSEVANPRVSLAPVETRSRRPGKEPMQLDNMEERRQLDKGRKPPKSGVEEKIVVNDNYSEQLVTVGGADMMGIPRAITKHSLDTYPNIKPKAQKKRSLAPDRRNVVTDEVNEWLKAGIVRRVRYPTWVANPVLVKKVDENDKEGRIKDDFPYGRGSLLLHADAFWSQECRGDISEAGRLCLQGADRGKPRSVRGRYGD